MLRAEEKINNRVQRKGDANYPGSLDVGGIATSVHMGTCEIPWTYVCWFPQVGTPAWKVLISECCTNLGFGSSRLMLANFHNCGGHEFSFVGKMHARFLTGRGVRSNLYRAAHKIKSKSDTLDIKVKHVDLLVVNHLLNPRKLMPKFFSFSHTKEFNYVTCF